MNTKSILLAGSALLLAGVSTSRVSASIPLDGDRVQLGGFFSQGWLYSSDNNYPTADKGGTFDFREMAVNVSTTVGSHLRLGGQAFAQRLGDLGQDKVILDWAIADYNFSPAFGLRAGRVKYPKGLYGEALDLDIVRPFVFLPGSVYSPVMRDFSASFNGGMAYGSINAGKGFFDYKVFGGKIPMSPSQGVTEFYNNAGFYPAPGATALSMDSVVGGQLTWNTPVSGLKFVYSFSQFTNLASDGPFVAYPAADLHSNIHHFTWNTLSTEYSVGNWVFAGEWQRTDSALRYSAPPVLATVDDKVGWDGWYLSVARRLNDRFEVGGYYGDLKNRFGTPTGGSRNYQHDSALSLRFDYSEHVLFKIEAHHIDGTYQTFNTARIPNPSSQLKSHTNLIAVKTTFSF